MAPSRAKECLQRDPDAGCGDGPSRGRLPSEAVVLEKLSGRKAPADREKQADAALEKSRKLISVAPSEMFQRMEHVGRVIIRRAAGDDGNCLADPTVDAGQPNASLSLLVSRLLRSWFHGRRGAFDGSWRRLRAPAVAAAIIKALSASGRRRPRATAIPKTSYVEPLRGFRKDQLSPGRHRA